MSCTGAWRGAARVVAAGAMAVALAGCWPAPGQGPDRQSHNPFESTITVDSVGSLAEAWSTDLGDAAVGAPIASPSGVHVESGLVLHTLDGASGAVSWEFAPDGGSPIGQMSDPVWQDGEVFVSYGFGSRGGMWQAQSFDAATGAAARTLGDGGLIDSLRGVRLVQSHVSGAPGLGPGGFLTVQGDLDDPSSRWTGVMWMAGFGDDGATGIPATAGTRGVYHVGRSQMTTTPAPEPTLGHGIRMYTYEQPPSCATSFPAPCPTWVTPLDGSSATPPVIGADEATLYTGTDVGTLYAVDAATGAVRWRASVGAPVTASPALAGGTLFVPTGDGDLVALDANGCGAPTCEPLWTGPAAGGGALGVQPASAGGVVFVGTAAGWLQAFPAAGCGASTCDPLWATSTGSRITGAPAVSGGRLYVGTEDGRVIAYAPEG